MAGRFLVAGLALVASLAPASAARGATALPPQGVYERCSPALSPAACEARLQRLGRAGFRVAVASGAFDGGATARDVLAYADAARAAGVKLIWTIPSLDRALIPYWVGIVRRHPATWGYYIWDEPKRSLLPDVSARSLLVKALDPHHPRMVMGCGICVGAERDISWLGGLDIVLGTDSYPVTYGESDPAAADAAVSEVVRHLRDVADANGRQTVVALQAWRWGDSKVDSESLGLPREITRFPTREEIEAQRNAALREGRPSLILWFMLPQVIGPAPGQESENWEQPRDTAERWSRLVGGAFAPLPNDRPEARFTVRGRRTKRGLRLVLDGRRSRDGDGRVARWRWSVAGKGTVCRRARCSVRVRRSRLSVKLVVTDDRGAATTARLRRRAPRRARWRLVVTGRPATAQPRSLPRGGIRRPHGNLGAFELLRRTR